MKKTLLFSLLSLLLIPQASAFFPDVDENHKNIDAITYVEDQGIVSGYPDGTFKPDSNLNRAEFTKILIESKFDSKTISECDTETIGLSDVSQDDWFAKYVCVAKSKGIIEGYPDGTFKGAREVNFAEAAKIHLETYGLAHCSGLANAPSLSDAPWYTPYMICLGDLELAPNAQVLPSALVSRGDMAQMVYKTLTNEDLMTKEEPIVKEEPNGSTLIGPETPAYIEFDKVLYAELKANNIPFVLNFSAPWCPSCQALNNQIIEALETMPKETLILRVDYDTETDLKQQFGIKRQTSGVFFDEKGGRNTMEGSLTFEAIKTFFTEVE